MTCALCPMIIENAIKKEKGIEKINVNFAEESLTLNYDEDEIAINDIKKKLSKIGYDIYEFGTENSNKNSESYKLKRDLIVCLILISPMILLMFAFGGPDCCITLSLTQKTEFVKFLESLRSNKVKDFEYGCISCSWHNSYLSF